MTTMTQMMEMEQRLKNGAEKFKALTEAAKNANVTPQSKPQETDAACDTEDCPPAPVDYREIGKTFIFHVIDDRPNGIRYTEEAKRVLYAEYRERLAVNGHNKAEAAAFLADKYGLLRLKVSTLDSWNPEKRREPNAEAVRTEAKKSVDSSSGFKDGSAAFIGRKCPRCERKITEPTYLYCPYCGEKLETVKEYILRIGENLAATLRLGGKTVYEGIVRMMLGYIESHGEG